MLKTVCLDMLFCIENLPGETRGGRENTSKYFQPVGAATSRPQRTEIEMQVEW